MSYAKKSIFVFLMLSMIGPALRFLHWAPHSSDASALDRFVGDFVILIWPSILFASGEDGIGLGGIFSLITQFFSYGIIGYVAVLLSHSRIKVLILYVVIIGPVLAIGYWLSGADMHRFNYLPVFLAMLVYGIPLSMVVHMRK